MILHSPFFISARLMPAIEIGNVTISIAFSPTATKGKSRYNVWFDFPNGKSYQDTSLRSGGCGGNLQEGMASLLSFLGAAGESYSYTMRTGRKSDNADLFEKPIVKWAYQNLDEISMIAYELEETKGLLEE
jgi:hypothetical protein